MKLSVHKGIRLCLRRLRTELTVVKTEFLHHDHNTHRVAPIYSQRGLHGLGTVLCCRFPRGRGHSLSSKLLVLILPSLCG